MSRVFFKTLYFFCWLIFALELTCICVIILPKIVTFHMHTPDALGWFVGVYGIFLGPGLCLIAIPLSVFLRHRLRLGETSYQETGNA